MGTRLTGPQTPLRGAATAGAAAGGSVPTDAVAAASDALRRLGDGGNPALADALGRLLTVVAKEAVRNAGFARALADALAGPPAGPDARRPETAPSQPDVPRPQASRAATAPAQAATEAAEPAAGRRTRRNPGVLDPFAVYAESGEPGLRVALATLDLEQLRDIVAEHGMNNDRLALRWKVPGRVVERIVERVVARSAKGSAFR